MYSDSGQVLVMIADMEDRGRLISAIVAPEIATQIMVLMKDVNYDGRPIDLETKIDQCRTEAVNDG